MKMLKKLLAVVLTGAMALTLLTACGGNAVGNAVTEKNIADVLTDMAKGDGRIFTFTSRAEEREMARNIAALLEGKVTDDDSKDAIEKILDYDQGGANADNFVWYGKVIADEIGINGQAIQIVYDVLDSENAENHQNLYDKNMGPADDRYIGTALCKMRNKDGEDSKLVTWRVIVVTAKAEGYNG